MCCCRSSLISCRACVLIFDHAAGSSSSASRAPSHGAHTCSANPVTSDPSTRKRLRKGVALEKGDFVFLLEDQGETVDAAARRRTKSRIKTELERENEQLREQLKFQVRRPHHLSAIERNLFSKVDSPRTDLRRCAPIPPVGYYSLL